MSCSTEPYLVVLLLGKPGSAEAGWLAVGFLEDSPASSSRLGVQLLLQLTASQVLSAADKLESGFRAKSVLLLKKPR